MEKKKINNKGKFQKFEIFRDYLKQIFKSYPNSRKMIGKVIPEHKSCGGYTKKN